MVAVAAIIATRILLNYTGFVPLYDGHAYSECVVNAAANGMSPASLRCYGHPAYFHLGVLAVLQLIDPGSTTLLLLGSSLVLAIATIGFHRLARRAFPAEDHRIDVALLTAGFLFQPAFLAATIQPNLDLPVLAGLIWCTVLVLERRWLLCGLVGTAMVFSKETGALLYGGLAACFAFTTLVSRTGSARSRIRSLLPALPAMLPLFAFPAYLIVFRFRHPTEAALWNVANGRSLWQEILVPRFDVYVVGYFAMIFVLSFAWVSSAWIGIDVVVAAMRRVRQKPARPTPGSDQEVIQFVTIVTAATVVALTRFITFHNVRYLAPALGLLPIVAYASLVRLGAIAAVRRTLLAAVAALLAVSAIRTIDPVSRLVWGTFRFGSHTMLSMTGITHECCGAGRDQITYSLEFAELAFLIDDVLARMQPDTNTVIGLPANMNWHTIGNLDRVSRRRTIRPDGWTTPVIMTQVAIADAAQRPVEVLYLALPNAYDPTGLDALSKWYDVGREMRFERHGYALSAYALKLRRTNQP